jgi:hypothetical protein
MSVNFLSLNPDETEFLLVGHPRQLAKLNHPTISLPDYVIRFPAKSARDFDVIFDSNLSFTEHVSAISESFLYYNHNLKRFRSNNKKFTARVIATALLHFKLN